MSCFAVKYGLLHVSPFVTFMQVLTSPPTTTTNTAPTNTAPGTQRLVLSYFNSNCHHILHLSIFAFSLLLLPLDRFSLGPMWAPQWCSSTVRHQCVPGVLAYLVY